VTVTDAECDHLLSLGLSLSVSGEERNEASKPMAPAFAVTSVSALPFFEKVGSEPPIRTEPVRKFRKEVKP